MAPRLNHDAPVWGALGDIGSHIVENCPLPCHIIGYEHTFTHTIADFVKAVVARKNVYPTFEDRLLNQRVLDAVAQSARTKRWVKC